MSSCSIDKCNLETYNDDKCILHCEKHDYSTDFRDIGFLNAFYDALLTYIIQSLENKGTDDRFHSENLRAYFTENQPKDREALEHYIKKQVVVFSNIFFPQSKDIDSFEYKKVLRKLGKVWFNYCEFSIDYLDLDEVECFFQDCKFHNGLLLYNFKILKNESDVLFQQCEFKNRVTSFSEESKKSIEASLFVDCVFTKIEFENTIFKKPIFDNYKGFQNSLEDFEMNGCIIEDRFVFNNHTMKSINIQDTVFNEKFELKKSTVTNFSIINSNFKGLVDCYNSYFEEFYIHKSIFEEFVGFEYCRFGKYKRKCENCSARFQYATFLNFVNMRNTKFISGLDMSDANLKEYPNFLGTVINPINTNKETFRIVKYSFDKVGNTSEANRFFSYEMAKDRQETFFWDNPEKKIMLTFNYLISNFGQSYLVPFIWICILMIIQKLSFDFIGTHTMVDLFPRYHYVPEWILNELNGLVINIVPLKRFLKEGMEFVSLLFFIAYSVLIYHFIIAVKRVTKR